MTNREDWYKDAHDWEAEAEAEAKRVGRRVRNGWCTCKEPLDEFYYRRGDTGLHGWACRRCWGITQTG